MDYTGSGNTPQRAAPAGDGAVHGLPALLGAGDARGRLPLRPRLRAGSPGSRRGPALGVLRGRPPGSGDLRGQADRRALGRGGGRLPGGELPGPVGRVERPISRHAAAYWRGDPGVCRSWLPAHRLQRPLRQRRAAALRQHQLRHRARRLHPHDLVSYEHKHNEANGEDNRDGTTTISPGTAARKARATIPAILRRRENRNATSSRPCSSRRAFRCSAPATSSGAPSTATTTPTARTTSSPGSTGIWMRRRGTPTSRAVTSLRREHRLPPAALLPGAGRPRRREGHRLAAARRQGDGRRGLERPGGAGARPAPGRRRHRGAGRAGQSGVGRYLRPALQLA